MIPRWHMAVLMVVVALAGGVFTAALGTLVFTLFTATEVPP